MNDDALAPSLDVAVTYRADLYQASGVLAMQLAILLGQALDRIRAHIISTSERLSSIAADIIAHRLRLPDDGEQSEREV